MPFLLAGILPRAFHDGYSERLLSTAAEKSLHSFAMRCEDPTLERVELTKEFNKFTPARSLQCIGRQGLPARRSLEDA